MHTTIDQKPKEKMEDKGESRFDWGTAHREVSLHHFGSDTVKRVIEKLNKLSSLLINCFSSQIIGLVKTLPHRP